MSKDSLTELAHLPELALLSAASSLTDDLASSAMAEFGFASDAVQVLLGLGLAVEAGGEWRVRPDLRSEAILYATSSASELWRDAHRYYFGIASESPADATPLYLKSGPGLAYHASEFDPQLGLEGYRLVAHIDSLATSLTSVRLAEEQSRRGVIDQESPTLVFLRGMTLYRMGRLSEAIDILRQIAALNEGTREVAVAQHLVGHWDCIRSSAGDPESARKLLKDSHKNAVKRHDMQHLAHVKHSMALCILKSSPTRQGTAIRLLRQSLQLVRDSGDTWGEAKVLHSLGQALSGTPTGSSEARDLLTSSLSIGQQLGYLRHVRSVEESLSRLGGSVRQNPKSLRNRSRRHR